MKKILTALGKLLMANNQKVIILKTQEISNEQTF